MRQMVCSHPGCQAVASTWETQTGLVSCAMHELFGGVQFLVRAIRELAGFVSSLGAAWKHLRRTAAMSTATADLRTWFLRSSAWVCNRSRARREPTCARHRRVACLNAARARRRNGVNLFGFKCAPCACLAGFTAPNENSEWSWRHFLARLRINLRSRLAELPALPRRVAGLEED